MADQSLYFQIAHWFFAVISPNFITREALLASWSKLGTTCTVGIVTLLAFTSSYAISWKTLLASWSNLGTTRTVLVATLLAFTSSDAISSIALFTRTSKNWAPIAMWIITWYREYSKEGETYQNLNFHSFYII